METQLFNPAIPVASQPGTIGDICRLVFVGIFLLLLAILLVRFLSAGLHKIPEGEIAVVERLGRFARVAGPGLVWVTPRLEQIRHTAHIRLSEEQFTIRNLWFRDVVQVDIDFTVCYWLDLPRVKQNLLREIAYRSPVEWHNAIESRAARILRDVISQYELMDLIGEDRRYQAEIERTFVRRLKLVLEEHGIRLREPEGAWLRDIRLTEDLQKALNNMRRTDIDIRTKSAIVDRIFKQYPGLSDVVLLSLFSMIGGQEKELVRILPITIGMAGKEATREEVRDEAGDREEAPSVPKTERDDSWRSLKPPPERDESRQGE